MSDVRRCPNCGELDIAPLTAEALEAIVRSCTYEVGVGERMTGVETDWAEVVRCLGARPKREPVR